MIAPLRINYINQVSDFRNNYSLDVLIREMLDRYLNEDWYYYIEFTGEPLSGSTDATVKAYTWDGEVLTLVAQGAVSGGVLRAV